MTRSTRLITSSVLAGVLVSACTSHSPNDPTGTLSAFAGTWTGAMFETSCTGTCFKLPTPTDFFFRVNDSLEGVVQVQSPPLVINVVGTRESDGTIHLKGDSGLTLDSIGTIDMRIAGSPATTLTGSLRYTLLNSSTGMLTTREGSIAFLHPVTTVSSGPAEGLWQGYKRRRTCTGDCTFASALSEFRLVLSQSGNQVSGWFGYGDTVQMAGTIFGSTLTLRRQFADPSCHPYYDHETVDCASTMTLSLKIDSLERMTGTIDAYVEGINASKGRFSFTATNELAGVVRIP